MKEVDKALKRQDEIATKEAKRIDAAFKRRDDEEIENLEEATATEDQMIADGTYDAQAQAENFDEYIKDDSKYEAQSIKRIVRAFDKAANESEKKCSCGCSDR